MQELGFRFHEKLLAQGELRCRALHPRPEWRGFPRRLNNLLSETDEEKAKANAFIKSGDFRGLSKYLNVLRDAGKPGDHFCVRRQETTVEVPDPTDDGVSEDEEQYRVTVTLPVKAGYPGEVPETFIKCLGISRYTAHQYGLTFHVSNLFSGDTWELDVDGKSL